MKLDAKQSVLASYRFLLAVLIAGASNSGDFSSATFFPPVTSPLRNGILRRSERNDSGDGSRSEQRVSLIALLPQLHSCRELSHTKEFNAVRSSLQLFYLNQFSLSNSFASLFFFQHSLVDVLQSAGKIQRTARIGESLSENSTPTTIKSAATCMPLTRTRSSS